MEQLDRTFVSFRGRKLIYFGGCDYYRLASHPTVLRTLTRAIGRYSLNVAASRVTTGNHPLYLRAEQELAKFFQAPSALLVASGYTANLVLGQALAGKFSHALIDARSHASVCDAAAFLGCAVHEFRHRDPQDAARISRRWGAQSRVILLTDGMFSHDGSVAPLKEYLDALPRNAWIFVDDAHAAGVIGRRGRGSVELAAVDRDHVVQTATLSKAFGVYGGVVLAPRAVQEMVVQRSRLFSGNTPLPLPLLAAGLAALQLFKTTGGLLRRLRANSTYVKTGLRRAGWDLPDHPGPIISLVPTSSAQAARLSRKLLAAGIYPPLIHYPGGPEGGYFRFAISSEHTREQLDRMVEVLGGW